VATKDSAVRTELRGADLVALQPYLGTAAEARVQRGESGFEAFGQTEKGLGGANGGLFGDQQKK